MRKLLFFIGLLHVSFFVGMAESAIVSVVRAEGPVNPVMAEFLNTEIDRATQDGDGLLVVELDTPGGLDTSMRQIVKKLLGAAIPVAVYVSPSGARAASAGVFITLAAPIAAMAPGTNIGAAHPVNLGGKQMDETMAAKVVNDAAAYGRSIAERRGRNMEWAEKAVRDSVSADATEALEKNIVDTVAVNLEDLLKQLDGRAVELPAGTVTLSTASSEIRRREMSTRLEILNVISNPSVAYLLMLAGILGIYIELTNPGTIFPGVVGAICLIMAFYALQTLPVNYAGVLLIFLAFVLFLLELKVPSFGLLTVGAVVSMLVGSLMLFKSADPFLRLSLSLIIPTVVLFSGFFGFVSWSVVRAQRARVTTGIEGLLGMEGRAISALSPQGQVSIHGEIWQAESEEPVEEGAAVVAVSVEGLKLRVKKKSR